MGVFTPLLPDSRQTMALYFTGLALALSSLIVWAVSVLSLAAHKAFRAGHDTAAQSKVPRQRAPELRLVAHSDN